jgi:hypothetical protein
MTSIRLPRALKALLGPAFQDAVPYEVRIEGVGEDTYLRVYKPAAPGEIVGLKDQLQASLEPKDEDLVAMKVESPVRPITVAELKGGPLAQRAGILCNEGGFRVFIGATDKDHAATIIRERCGITSRAQLDHVEEAARKFRDLSRDYDAWLRGED